MSNSLNLSLVENNFDLLRNYTKDTTLLAGVDHQIYLWGVINRLFYNPISSGDIEWTVEQVKTIEQMERDVDHQDAQNATLLVLIGKMKQLELIFKAGIERFADANPHEKEKVLQIVANFFPKILDPVLNPNAPPPPRLPQPGAKQQQSPVWEKTNDGKKVLTIKEYTPRPPADVMNELLKRLKNGIALNVAEFERNLQNTRNSQKGKEWDFLNFRASVADSEGEEDSEITSAW